MLFVQGDVLNPEAAAADRVSLVLVLLVSGSQGELVDEVEGHCALSDSHLLGPEVCNSRKK